MEHDPEVESASTRTGKHGAKVKVRSYRCKICGAVWSDTGTVPPCEGTKKNAGQDTGKEEAMAAKGNGQDKSKRLQNALEEGWEYGHIYKRTVKRRKDGKEFTCTMKPTKSGFVDQDGTVWDAPTALTTSFMNKKVGVAGRRPAKHFFEKDPKTPKPRDIDTRPDAKKDGKPEKVKATKAPKAAKAPKAQKAAKPAKAVKAPKAKAAKAEAPAPPAQAAPPPPPPEMKMS